MPEFNPSTAVFRSDADRLLRLINLDETTPEQWQPEDIAMMVRHQLQAPLEFDLLAVELGRVEAKTRHQALTKASAGRIRSFADLIFHKEPPLELLRLAKEFFKRRTQDQKKDSPEWQVAYLFYLLSILIARNRDPKISVLTAAELRRGAEWALSRVWLDDKTREVLAKAQQGLQARSQR